VVKPIIRARCATTKIATEMAATFHAGFRGTNGDSIAASREFSAARGSIAGAAFCAGSR
jgi:hypothetical protein